MMTFSGMTTLELRTTDEAAEPVLYTPQTTFYGAQWTPGKLVTNGSLVESNE
jgi:hypothetical protein